MRVLKSGQKILTHKHVKSYMKRMLDPHAGPKNFRRLLRIDGSQAQALKGQNVVSSHQEHDDVYKPVRYTHIFSIFQEKKLIHLVEV